jgi:hypothetical protein
MERQLVPSEEAGNRRKLAALFHECRFSDCQSENCVSLSLSVLLPVRRLTSLPRWRQSMLHPCIRVLVYTGMQLRIIHQPHQGHVKVHAARHATGFNE